MPFPTLAPSAADLAKLILRVENLERKLRTANVGGFNELPAEAPTAGFPIRLNDGTYTYEITAGDGAMDISAWANAAPLAVTKIDFDPSNGDLNVKVEGDTFADFNVRVNRDLNFRSNDRDVNLLGARAVNIRSAGEDEFSGVFINAATGRPIGLGPFIEMQALADDPYEPPTPGEGMVRIWARWTGSAAELKIKYDDGSTDTIAAQ